MVYYIPQPKVGGTSTVSPTKLRPWWWQHQKQCYEVGAVSNLTIIHANVYGGEFQAEQSVSSVETDL